MRSSEARRLNAGVQLESGEGKEKAVTLEPFLGVWGGQCHHREEQSRPTLARVFKVPICYGLNVSFHPKIHM